MREGKRLRSLHYDLIRRTSLPGRAVEPAYFIPLDTHVQRVAQLPGKMCFPYGVWLCEWHVWKCVNLATFASRLLQDTSELTIALPWSSQERDHDTRVLPEERMGLKRRIGSFDRELRNCCCAVRPDKTDDLPRDLRRAREVRVRGMRVEEGCKIDRCLLRRKYPRDAPVFTPCPRIVRHQLGKSSDIFTPGLSHTLVFVFE